MTKIPGSSRRWMLNQVVSAPGAAAHGKQHIWVRTQPRSIEPVSSMSTHTYLTQVATYFLPATKVVADDTKPASRTLHFQEQFSTTRSICSRMPLPEESLILVASAPLPNRCKYRRVE